jgi:hypothetical protein
VEGDLAFVVDEEASAVVVSVLLKDYEADVRVHAVTGYAVDLDSCISGCDPCDLCIWVDFEDGFAVAD